jgi:hypothetical protein
MSPGRAFGTFASSVRSEVAGNSWVVSDDRFGDAQQVLA